MEKSPDTDIIIGKKEKAKDSPAIIYQRKNKEGLVHQILTFHAFGQLELLFRHVLDSPWMCPLDPIITILKILNLIVVWN